MFKKDIFQKLYPYLKGDIVNIEIKDYNSIKEVILEYKNGDKYVGNLNSPTFQLKKLTGITSIAEYFARGNYGKNSWRGNCSGLLIKDLLTHFNVNEFCDPMVGSGTSLDVAKDLGIKCTGVDLNPKYGGFNALHDELDKSYDFMFLHPPYLVFQGSNMPTYSGNMWGRTPHIDDGSHIHNTASFTKWLNKILWNCYQSLNTGGRMAVLVGDSRYKGQYYSMFKSMNIYGTLENVIIKKQHNCISDNYNYKSNKFIPVRHEYLVIIKKNECRTIPCLIVSEKEFDIMHIKNITWKALIQNTIEFLRTSGIQVTRNTLFNQLKNHPKSKENNHLKEKIRQTINSFPKIFKKYENGTIGLIA